MRSCLITRKHYSGKNLQFPWKVTLLSQSVKQDTDPVLDKQGESVGPLKVRYLKWKDTKEENTPWLVHPWGTA